MPRQGPTRPAIHGNSQAVSVGGRMALMWHDVPAYFVCGHGQARATGDALTLVVLTDSGRTSPARGREHLCRSTNR